MPPSLARAAPSLRALALLACVCVSLAAPQDYSLYDVTSDDYPLDELSVILRNQQLLLQQQRQQQQLQQQRGEQPLAAAMAAAVAAEAEAEAEAEAAAATAEAERRHKYPREAVTLAAAVAAAVATRGQLARLGLAPPAPGGGAPALAIAPALERQPAFSYEEPAGQVQDGQRAPFAYSPADARFYEEPRSQIPETDRGAPLRGGEYADESRREGVSAQTAAAADAAPDGLLDATWRRLRESVAPAPSPPSALAPDQERAAPAPAPSEAIKKMGQEQRLVADAANGEGVAGAGGRSVANGGVEVPAPAVAAAAAAANPGAADLALPPVANLRPGENPSDPDPDDEDEDGETEDEGMPLSGANVEQQPVFGAHDNSDLYFIAIVAGCCAAAVVGIIAVGVSWYRLQKNAKAAADVEYPAYGVTGPNKDVSPTGDRRLAHSAQMFHYQHQKQQIIAMESRIPAERNGSVSEAESEEENEEGDYTVYECPGLAPTGEMEVKNPLFLDDPTPVTPAAGPLGGTGGAGGQGASASGGALTMPAAAHAPSASSTSPAASSSPAPATPATAHKTSTKGEAKQQQQKTQPKPPQKP